MRCARAFLGLGLLTAGVACGGPARGPHDPISARRGSPEEPAFVAITREGDPQGTVAVAMALSTVDPRAPVALAAVFEARLGGATRSVLATPARSALRIVAPSATMDEVRTALVTPISAADRVVAEAKLRAFPSARPPEAVGACTGIARGLSARDITEAELETLRRDAVIGGRLAFGVVGSSSYVARASAPLPWPRGANDARPTPPDPAFELRAPEGSGDGGARTAGATVLTWVAARDEGLAARVGRELLPLPALFPGLAKVDVDVHFRVAGGACLAVDVEGAPPDALPALLAFVRAASRRALSASDHAKAPEAALAREADARVAAERAAWWGLTRDGAAGDRPVEITDARVFDRELTGDRLRAQTERAEALSKAPRVEARVRTEQGQRELWLLVGSPCGTAFESRDDAGTGALFMASVAHTLMHRYDLAAEPFLDADGVGLYVHDTQKRGESAEALAERLGNAVGAAWAQLDDRSIEAGRALLLPMIRRGAALRDLSREHPSWLSPAGNEESRIPNGLLKHPSNRLRLGPVRMAALAFAGESQAAAARAALDRWMIRAEGQGQCPATPPATLTLGKPSGKPDGGLTFALPLTGAPAFAAAEAWAPRLADEATRLGAGPAWAVAAGGARGGALVVHVDSGPGPQSAQVLAPRLRAALAGARAGTLPPTPVAFDPRRRLAELFLGRAVATQADLQALAARLDSDDWIVSP